jgi:hypothetical protein
MDILGEPAAYAFTVKWSQANGFLNNFAACLPGYCHILEDHNAEIGYNV